MQQPIPCPEDIPVEEAQRLVLSSVRPLPAVEEALHDAVGRFLVGDIVAPRAAPPFDNSAMDGFAIAHTDGNKELPSVRREPVAPVRFAVVGLATAGGPWCGTLAPGQAVKIMTGALIPAGADTVVMKEVCTEGAGVVAVSKLPPKGLNIRRAGEDIRKGETALGTGERVGPIEIAALASMGMARVRVRPRPVVAILSTGSELVALGEEAPADGIYDSNAHALAALVAALGATPLRLGIARDTPDAVGEILRAAPPHDALLTTGGVSVGEFDFVKESLRALGCRDLFWRVQMRPGRPAFGGMLGDRPIFGLPGNAVSCMVTFWVLAAPALRAMAGDPDPIPAPRPATLAARIEKKRGLVAYTRARVSWEEGRLVAAPTIGQMSHQVFGQRGANALVVTPVDREVVEAGEAVSVIPFGAAGWTADL